MSEGKASIESFGKLAWTAVQVATAAGMLGAALGGWVKMPARLAAVEEQQEDLPIIRAQLDWTTRVMSDRFKVEPPDLSRFERPRRRRDR